MQMERASTRTVGNPILLSLRAMTKGRRVLGIVVSILNAFTATVNPTNGIVEDVVEEEELVESKFKKMDDQDDLHIAYEKLYKFSEKHEKLYRLATKKLSDVELDCEELSTKFDKANQTIRALRFENNFLAEKTKKLEKELS